MKSHLIEQFVSQERFEKYDNIDEYQANLIKSKQSYIPLSVMEVALRNSIDKLLSTKLAEDWHEDTAFLTTDSIEKIKTAKEILRKRGEPHTKQKIIAELSLGFWVNLFKKPYEMKWRISDLVKIFDNLPPRKDGLINREVIYGKLNLIRNYRNRVFHYEKITNKSEYHDINDRILEILGYLDAELRDFCIKANA